ncbi:MAG TPA: hypothetical protein VN512_00040 [Clostridia bacterium]|nr:hypothetical protein [Clostridia bacterium]
MPVERMELTEFVVDRPRRFARGVSGKRGRQTRTDARSMLVKLGICALMCALVLLLSALQDKRAGESYALDSAGEEPFDETLGKLKFVELPGILEVFAAEDKLEVKLDYDAAELIGDDTTLMFVSAAAQTVSLPVDGRVKAVGSDAELGAYVCVVAANDSEFQYYGLSNIAVEEGQTLKALDSLGVIEAGESLFIKVNVSGRPENPTQFFDVGEDGV